MPLHPLSWCPVQTFSIFWYLLHGCRLLGTPNEQVWPGVSLLPNWHDYPQWSPQGLSSAVPNLDDDGLHLLSVTLDFLQPYFHNNYQKPSSSQHLIADSWNVLLVLAANVAIWSLKAHFCQESHGTPLLCRSRQSPSLNSTEVVVAQLDQQEGVHW